MEEYINITLDNIDQEHICCAISDKKHFEGVFNKKEWLKKRITEGHVFRKLNVQRKVFVEYAPLEKAWVPIEGNGFLYIYCTKAWLRKFLYFLLHNHKKHMPYFLWLHSHFPQ